MNTTARARKRAVRTDGINAGVASLRSQAPNPPSIQNPSQRRQRNHHHHALPPMTASSPLLHHHLTATAAAVLLLLDPASSPSRAPLKRKRLDDGEDNGPEVSALPAHPPPPIPLPPTSPDQFPLVFRVSAPTFHFLSGLLDPLLSHPFLPSHTLLALALARLASGLPYPELAALFRVPPSAPRAASRRLRRVLLANFRFWLAFPSDPSNPAAASSSSRLSSCRGALACVRFAGPYGPLAVQLVAGSTSRILSLAAGFRGDRGDLEVLRLSSLYHDLEQGKVLEPAEYLVGDSIGYPLLPWLMVPFQGPVVPGSPEAEFNAAHKAMCRPVRRAVRSLMGWGAIARLHEEESPRAAVACIGTCAMLHNVLLGREDYSALAPEEGEDADHDLGVTQSLRNDAGVDGFEVDARALVLRSTLASTRINR